MRTSLRGISIITFIIDILFLNQYKYIHKKNFKFFFCYKHDYYLCNLYTLSMSACVIRIIIYLIKLYKTMPLYSLLYKCVKFLHIS